MLRGPRQLAAAGWSTSTSSNVSAVLNALIYRIPADFYLLILKIIVRVLEFRIAVAIKNRAVQRRFGCCVAHFML